MIATTRVMALGRPRRSSERVNDSKAARQASQVTPPPVGRLCYREICRVVAAPARMTHFIRVGTFTEVARCRTCRHAAPSEHEASGRHRTNLASLRSQPHFCCMDRKTRKNRASLLGVWDGMGICFPRAGGKKQQATRSSATRVKQHAKRSSAACVKQPWRRHRRRDTRDVWWNASTSASTGTGRSRSRSRYAETHHRCGLLYSNCVQHMCLVHHGAKEPCGLAVAGPGLQLLRKPHESNVDIVMCPRAIHLRHLCPTQRTCLKVLSPGAAAWKTEQRLMECRVGRVERCKKRLATG